jgi:hypothetical protein
VVIYATAADLASYLQQDVDTATATLVLTLASGQFTQAADTWWSPQSITYTHVGTRCTSLVLPFLPVTSVTAVRINGVTVTGYTLINGILYRPVGFGVSWARPPDKVEVDLVHGYTTASDDVKAAVLDMAAQAYTTPVGAVVGESIDDYQVRYANAAGGVQLTPFAAGIAAEYRGVTIA